MFVFRSATLVVLLSLSACDGGMNAAEETGNTTPAGAFSAAEESSGVPQEILMAISRAETRFQMVVGEEEDSPH